MGGAEVRRCSGAKVQREVQRCRSAEDGCGRREVERMEVGGGRWRGRGG